MQVGQSDDCDAVVPLEQLQRALKEDTIKKWMPKIQVLPGFKN